MEKKEKKEMKEEKEKKVINGVEYSIKEKER